jgi:acyl-CoA dehydrogenase
MDFSPSETAARLTKEIRKFMNEEVIPSEDQYRREIAESGSPYIRPSVMDELRAKARQAGLWNLSLRQVEWGGAGLTNSEFAPLCEEMGRSLIGPEVFNCHPPDAGNMSTLADYGTPEQKEQWLVPMAEGKICSCFSMTEPGVAGSDAHNVSASIVQDGDDYVLNAVKWFSTGAAREMCEVCIFIGVVDPDAKPYPKQALILVPLETPGVTLLRTLEIFGYRQPISHGEISFEDVRVPLANRIRTEGDGFDMGQARLNPGRLHHSLRAIGMAERALQLMCSRVADRETFGTRLSDQPIIRDWIARSRFEIEQARLLAMKAVWSMDEVGGLAARQEIASLKVVAPEVALRVIDRAIQAHGAAGVSQDTPLAEMWTQARTLRILDGPDEVHVRSLGRWELRDQLGSPQPLVDRQPSTSAQAG